MDRPLFDWSEKRGLAGGGLGVDGLVVQFGAAGGADMDAGGNAGLGADVVGLPVARVAGAVERQDGAAAVAGGCVVG